MENFGAIILRYILYASVSTLYRSDSDWKRSSCIQSGEYSKLLEEAKYIRQKKGKEEEDITKLHYILKRKEGKAGVQRESKGKTWP